MSEAAQGAQRRSVEATWKLRFDIAEDELDGGFVASTPDLPGCWTQGDTTEELEANIVDAVETWFHARLGQVTDEDADVVPEPVIAVH